MIPEVWKELNPSFEAQIPTSSPPNLALKTQIEAPHAQTIASFRAELGGIVALKLTLFTTVEPGAY